MRELRERKASESGFASVSRVTIKSGIN